MLHRLLSVLLVHRMIHSNIVSLFRVFTIVVVATMASPLLGAIGEFEPLTETFTVYSERLDQFFVANNIGSYPTSVLRLFLNKQLYLVHSAIPDFAIGIT